MENNLTAITTAATRNILLGILETGTTKNSVAIRAGIAPATFYRKIHSCGDFTLRELDKIAGALGVQFEDLIKDAA